MLESCKQALDKYHQVDKVMCSLLPLSSLTHGWCGVISLLSVSASCQQPGVCVHCAQMGPDTLLDISVEFSLMVCCQLSAWSPECICLLSNADAGITNGMFVCQSSHLLQALCGRSASQHSFELQDCALHLHQHIISLRHQQSLTPEGHQAGRSSPPITEQGSIPAGATAVIEPKSGIKSEAADSSGNAAAARNAQAKARQAAMMDRMKQQQALFKDTGSEGDAVNANKVFWTIAFLSLTIHLVSAQLHLVLCLAISHLACTCQQCLTPM